MKKLALALTLALAVIGGTVAVSSVTGNPAVAGPTCDGSEPGAADERARECLVSAFRAPASRRRTMVF